MAACRRSARSTRVRVGRSAALGQLVAQPPRAVQLRELAPLGDQVLVPAESALRSTGTTRPADRHDADLGARRRRHAASGSTWSSRRATAPSTSVTEFHGGRCEQVDDGRSPGSTALRVNVDVFDKELTSSRHAEPLRGSIAAFAEPRRSVGAATCATGARRVDVARRGADAPTARSAVQTRRLGCRSAGRAEAAASSSHQTVSSPRDAAGGGLVRREPSAARARATASALPSPLATNQTARQRSIASKVRVTRSGGGLGESWTATAIASRASRAGWPGKREAQWPSGPMPSISTSKKPAPCCAQRRAVGRGGVLGGRHLRRSPAPRGRWPGRRRPGRAAPRGPGARCGRGSRPARSARRPTRTRRATSRRRSRGARRASSRWSSSAIDAAGEPDLRHLAARLRGLEPVEQRGGDVADEGVGVVVAPDLGRRSLRAP